MPHRTRSSLLAFLVVFALTLSPVFGASRPSAVRSTSSQPSASVVSRVWSALQNVFGRSGAEMDPNGAPKPASTGAHVIQAPPTTNLGGTMDPDG